MGLTTTAPLVLPTRRVLAFTSSTTWTVPSSALYVDVMVVGGGSGGAGGCRQAGQSSPAGAGGAITIQNNIYLGGTGTVSIVVGAGSNGAAGSSTGSSNQSSSAGYSAFGTYVYSQGGLQSNNGQSGNPGYKGTSAFPYNGGDTTISNFAPILTFFGAPNVGASLPHPNSNTSTNAGGPNYPAYAFGVDGSSVGYSGGSNNQQVVGGYPGGFTPNNTTNFTTIATNSLPWNAASVLTLGTPTAGTAASGGGAGGAAGPSGYAGAGGGCGANNNSAGYQGNVGAGGGGGNGNGGTTGGNGGNAGTNTGAGGGQGGNTGSTGAGTGGIGGNGAAGFVIVSYIGIN